MFLPLHVKGELLFRKIITVSVRPYNIDVEYVVSIYSTKRGTTPDKGLVVRMYERGRSETCVLHINSVEVIRLMQEAEEEELLKHIRDLKDECDAIILDELEQSFIILSEKGDREIQLRGLISQMAEIVVADLGIKKDSQNKDVPHLKSSKFITEDYS